ncbi:MAG: sensor histidine kinase [Candidatus Leucobacter sulfamidivorax]|nr:sensor histidine kinase [Candidatus Leucobacter sulfamidivorax]
MVERERTAGRMEPPSEPRSATRGPLMSPPLLAVVYALLAVVFAALGLSGLWDVFSLLPDPVSPWWTLATAIPAAALVLLKQRAPGAGLIAVVVLFAADLLTTGGIVPLLVVLELMQALILVLSAEHRRRALVGVVAACALVAVAALLRSGDIRVALMIALPFGALLGFSYWYANSTAQSRELVELYRQRAEDATRLAEFDRSGAVRDERERMARELHDIVAGHVTAVAIRSEAALMSGGSAPPVDGAAPASREREALRAVRDSSLEAHGALRSMIAVLREGSDGFSAPIGREMVPRLVEEAERSGVRVTLHDGIEGSLCQPSDHALGRVVQEALANSVRHASGGEVEVRLREADRVDGADSVDGAGDVVVVEVSSRGGGSLVVPELRGSGLGLGLLAERVRIVGGEFSAGREGEAWVVRARLPRGTAFPEGAEFPREVER